MKKITYGVPKSRQIVAHRGNEISRLPKIAAAEYKAKSQEFEIGQ